MNIQNVLALIDERITDAEILRQRSSPNSNEATRAYYTLDVLRNLRRDVERNYLRETEAQRRRQSVQLMRLWQELRVREVQRRIEQ